MQAFRHGFASRLVLSEWTSVECSCTWATAISTPHKSTYSSMTRICERGIIRSNFKIVQQGLCVRARFYVKYHGVKHVVRPSTHTFFSFENGCTIQLKDTNIVWRQDIGLVLLSRAHSYVVLKIKVEYATLCTANTEPRYHPKRG